MPLRVAGVISWCRSGGQFILSPDTWGRHDPIFLPAGAEAFKRDIPDAKVVLYETGHFALETHAVEIGAAIREFLDRNTEG